MQILLHKNALFNGMNVKTFCHKTAYNPNVAITQPKKRKYGKDKKECCDANLENTPVPEYTKNENKSKNTLRLVNINFNQCSFIKELSPLYSMYLSNYSHPK